MPSSLEITTPSEREILVTRTFDAPSELVFEYHTKPQYVRQWLLGPPGWSMPICEIDLRAGGRYRYVWRNDADGSEFGVHGEFREVAAPNRLVHTESMDGMPGEAICTSTFAKSGNQTLFTLVMQFFSREERDRALQSGMTDGMSMSYDRLENLSKNQEPTS
jgi:uncharacterized protein YndB with AHSA1/START domain